MRFVKISNTGEHLAADATDWVAVLDTTTGLMWTASNLGDDEVRHAAAVELAAGARVAGFDDWKLPTVEQLFPLADRTRQSPAIDTAFFPTCESDWYWTSSPAAWAPERGAWLVDFYHGFAGAVYRDDLAFVRAVRSASAPGQ